MNTAEDYLEKLECEYDRLSVRHGKLQKHSRNQRAALRRFNKSAQVIYMGNLYGRYVARGDQVRELQFEQRDSRVAVAWGFFRGCVIASLAFVAIRVILS